MNPAPVARRGVVIIKPPISSKVYRFIAACSGFTKWLDDGGVIFDASRTHIDRWNRDFPDVPIACTDGTLDRACARVAPVTPVPRMLVPPLPPWAHQDRAHSIIQCRNAYGFFYDMGTGKSAIIIQGIAELRARDKIDRALVLTTKRGLPQFLNEQLPQYMPKGVQYRAAQWNTTQFKNSFKYPGDNLLIALASPGALQSPKQAKELLAWCEAAKGRLAIFVDESQQYKTWGAKRSENLIRLQPFAEYRYIFSGEPAPNGYEDLYAQFYFLNENIIGHASKTSFVNQFCITGGYSGREIVDYRNVTELTELIAPHCEFLKITDCLDMPPQSWREAKYVPVQEQVDLYHKMRTEFVIEVERVAAGGNMEIVQRACENAASKFVALQQISNGWCYMDAKDPNTDSPREVYRITTERAKFVMEEFAENTNKCIVWARFHEDLAMLAEAAEELKIDAVELSGRVPDAQCEKNKLRFQNDPKCKVFFGTVASGGESLNLQVCQTQVFHSNTFNYGHRVQAEARTWRGGQTQHCQYIDIIGLPIDRMIRRNALEKKDLSLQLRTAAGLARLAQELDETQEL